MIERQKEKYGWEFLFLGANIDAIATARRFGITEDEIMDMMLFAVPAALVSIRAYYVLFNLDNYRLADGSFYVNCTQTIGEQSYTFDEAGYVMN